MVVKKQHQHLHKAWHSPSLPSPIPGRSDQQTSPSLSCHTTVKNIVYVCVCVCVSIFACCLPQHCSVRPAELNKHLKSEAPWSKWLKLTKTSSEVLCLAQASIHNHRATCNSQCDQVFSKETNSRFSAMSLHFHWCSESSRHVVLPV